MKDEAMQSFIFAYWQTERIQYQMLDSASNGMFQYSNLCVTRILSIRDQQQQVLEYVINACINKYID